MPNVRFCVKLNSHLVPIAREMHAASRIGDRRRGPGQSLEAYLSDVLTCAIIDRVQPTVLVPIPAQRARAKVIVLERLA